MTKAMFLFALGTVGLGCGDAKNNDDEPAAIESQIFAATDLLWQTPAGQIVTPISVCFENGGGWGTQIGWVTTVLENNWDAVTGIDFQGYGPCTSSGGIHVVIEDVTDAPHTDGLGWQYGKVHLNFSFFNWNTSCQSNLQFCIQAIALHEFGHAIGLAHEQNRPDSLCTGMSQGGNGDVYFQYDPQSVMNYCQPYRTNLSSLDQVGIQRLYGGGADLVPGQLAMMGLSGHYLSVQAAAGRSSASITVPTSASGGLVVASSASPLAYGQTLTLRAPNWTQASNSLTYLGFSVKGDPRFGVLELALLSSPFAWTIGRVASGQGGATLNARDPFTLSTVYNGQVYYLAQLGSGNRDDAFRAALTTGPSEWRFIGPLGP